MNSNSNNNNNNNNNNKSERRISAFSDMSHGSQVSDISNNSGDQYDPAGLLSVPGSGAPKQSGGLEIGAAAKGKFDRSSFLENIFGTGDEADSKKEGDAKSGTVPFNPKGELRARWDAAIIFLSLYTCVAFPLRITFGSNKFSGFSGFDLFVDACFITDVVLNFYTGYDDGGLTVMSKLDVRRNYLQNHLIIDCISSIPTDIFLLAGQGLSKIGGLYLRLPHLLRIFRLSRFFRYLQRWQDTLPFNTSVHRIIKLLLVVLLFSHFNACLQFYITELENFPENGWVYRSCAGDSPYSTCLIEASPTTQYLFALFKSLSHMLCIGYGQEAPRTQGEIWITIFSMLMGASFYIVMIGMMSSIMLAMDRAGARYREQMVVWKEYFAFLSLPHELRKRVTSHFERRWYTRKFFDEAEMLNELSPFLRHDVMMHLCKDLVNQTPLFRACKPIVVTSIVPLLIPMSMTQGELVYSSGTIADGLFFILSGTINIESAQGDLYTVLKHGSYFGEYPLLYPSVQTRSASARAASFVELFFLSKKNFEEITMIFPELLDLMRSIADAREAIFKAQNSGRTPSKAALKSEERKKERQSFRRASAILLKKAALED